MSRKGRYGQFIRSIFTIIDFAVLNISYVLVYALFGISDFFTKPIWLLLNITFMLVELISSRIHERRVVFADRVIIEAVRTVAIHLATFLAILSFLDIDINPMKYVEFYAFFLSGLSIWWIISRKILKRYRTLGFNFRRTIIIGGGAAGSRLISEMLSDAGYGYRILGMFDDNKKNRGTGYYAGTFGDVEMFVKQNLIDEMYCTVIDDDLIARMIKIADNNAVDFYYVPQFSKNVARKFELSSIGNVPILALRPNPLNSIFNRFVKRAVDLIISSLVLICSPIILIPVAIGIKISSKGPIFFKQKRTGYRGKEFWCYKFRTMRVNSDSDKIQATRNDPRKTKFGDFLRKTSIDELPQFFNVWRGEMSIVGPRPHMVKHTHDYSALIDKYMLRHTIKPGITGWAQVNGLRGQTEHLWQMEKRVEYDVWYAENWNLMLDLKILFLTVYNAIKGEKNAF